MAERADLPRSAAGPYSPWLIAVIVSIATFMEVLDSTIANVALRHIAGSLAASQDESTYIITSYLVSNAIVLPISGWLANVFGRKRFYMSCVVLFTIASVGCGLSTNLTMMVICRIIQGVGGGGLAPIEQSIFADSFPPHQRAASFALYGFTVITAPAIGPVLGGWLTDNYSWQWVFFINLPVGIVSLILTGLFVSDSAAVKEDRRKLLSESFKIDYIGFALVILTFGTLQIVLDRYVLDDGMESPFIFWLAVVSAASAIALVWRELVIEHPIVNLRLLRNRPFAISNVVMFLFGFVIMSTTQLLPQLTQELLGYDAITAGETLGLGGAITLCIMPIAGAVTGNLIQPRWLVLMALIGVGCALHYCATLDLTATFFNFSFSRVIQVIWLPFLFIPLSAVQFIGIPPKHNNEASAIINLIRNLGGSIGVAVAVILLSHRTQFHHARLAEHITVFNGYTPGPGLQSIAHRVDVQASIMSYLDVFTVLSICAFVVAPLAIFLPKVPKGAQMGH